MAEKQISAGKSDLIEVTLADASNFPRVASFPVTIDLQTQWTGGKINHFAVPIMKGSTSGQVSINMPVSGICRIRALEYHFLPGNLFVLVSKPPPASLTKRVKIAMRGQAPRWEEMTVRNHINQVIEFSYDTTRPYIADGRDSSEVFVSLSKAATSDITIDILTSQGERSVSIQKGKMFASLNVVSDKSNELKFQRAQSNLGIPIKGLPFDLDFIAPIVNMNCSASPPVITLIEEAEIVISLLDSSKKPHKTLFPRMITLQIDKGRGEMDSAEIIIPAGSFEGRTRFRPTMLGGISISSMADELPKQYLALSVSLPIFILLLSVLGGIAGGFIAKLQKSTDHWRILVGMITGFILYWAFVIGLLSAIPHSIALNPFSAFGISAIGGWLGSNIFNILMPKLGLSKG